MRRDHGAIIALGAVGALAALGAASRRRGGRNEWGDDEGDEPQHQVVEQLLAERGIRNIGLNSDWSVSAYRLGDKDGYAHYLTDNEDGTWSVSRRFTGQVKTVAQLQAQYPGWDYTQPVPFAAYRDYETGSAPPQAYRQDWDGHNDMIVEVWSSDQLPGGYDEHRSGDGAKLTREVLQLFPR